MTPLDPGSPGVGQSEQVNIQIGVHAVRDRDAVESNGCVRELLQKGPGVLLRGDDI